MEVEDGGEFLPERDVAVVGWWDVESEREGCGVMAVEGFGGVGLEEGRAWRGRFGECVQVEANAGEEPPDAGFEDEDPSWRPFWIVAVRR